MNSPMVWMPIELGEAWEIKQKYCSDSTFIAGGTLLQTQWEKGIDRTSHLISLEGIKEMQGWGKEQINGQMVTRLGGLTSLSNCRRSPVLLKDFPLLAEAIKTIAAPSIRNKATLGGNIANGFGDTIPVFLVLDATLSLFDESGYRHKSLWDFIREGNSLANSILEAIYLPEKIEVNQGGVFYKKVGYREAFTPSVVTISGCFRLNEHKEVEAIKLAAGGSTTQPQRLVGCEQFLKGSSLSNERLNRAYQVIKEEFITRTDAFTSAEYKKMVAANLIVSEIARLAA